MKSVGQSIIEYAGAITLAVILFAELIINTTPLSSMFLYIENVSASIIQSHLPK